jgi:uncharacterized membrane protein
MSIEPLKRVIGLIALALFVRCALAGVGVWTSQQGSPDLFASTVDTQAGMFLAARWGGASWGPQSPLT